MKFKTWEELTEVEKLQCTVSDLHKDRYGFRPRYYTEEQWNSEEFLQSVYDRLTEMEISDCITGADDETD